MKIACEEVVKTVLPAFRSMVASYLIHEYNFNQTNTAKILGTSQAVISYYESCKRGKKLQYYEKLEDLKLIATEFAKELATDNMDISQVAQGFCKLCIELRAKNLLLDQNKLTVTCKT